VPSLREAKPLIRDGYDEGTPTEREKPIIEHPTIAVNLNRESLTFALFILSLCQRKS
jgi:hypothetical protein